MRWRIAIAVLLISSMAAACGELGPVRPSPSGMTMTLTDSECIVDGVGALLEDHFVAKVTNKTSSMAVFNFHRLNDGYGYTELEAFIKARQQRILATGPEELEFKPPMTAIWAGIIVNPGQQDVLQAELPAGTYGVVCRRDSVQTGHALSIFVSGPFRVI